MKILFVATDYPERGKPTTGFPNYLYRVSTALVQMGHEPIILAAGRMDSHRVEQGINIWTIKMKYINTKVQVLDFVINSLRKGCLLNRKLEELLGKISIDVIRFT